jgi:geranylgeranyl reductase family protein
MTWDVIVVGAGPAGCAAATLLARQGLHVGLLDKSASPPPKVCGEYLSPGSLSILETLGALDPIRRAGARPLRGMVIHTEGGRTLRAVYPRGAESGAHPDHGLAIRRALLDPILLAVARESGAQFEANFQVADLRWEGKRVAGVVGRHHGRLCERRSRLVIGADGRNSVVTRRIGTVTWHPWLEKVALMGYVAGAHRDEDAGEVFLGRSCYGILNPIEPGLTNVGLVVNRSAFTPKTSPEGFLLGAGGILPGLEGRLANARLSGPVRCLGPLAHRASRVAVPGALLIGDAAGFLDPFTGEGIYTALRSAELAARSVVAGGRQARAALREYGRAWSRKVLVKWRLCMVLQHAIRRPMLAEWLVGRLSLRPQFTSQLMAVIGDLKPAHEFSLLGLFAHLMGGLPPSLTRIIHESSRE